jgi:hypothetical protein
MIPKRCTTATVIDLSGDLPQRTCVGRDQFDEVGLPVGAGLRKQTLQMGFDSGFPNTDDFGNRRNAANLADRREHAQFARRQPVELRDGLH